ncbi:MAG: tRNA (adenosine(37)-N6)-threonylcarbamoyltransferase complex dimerization subunit type 1 TsaB [Acidimicrobiia bacterium]
MVILGLDTATPGVGVAVGAGGQVIGQVQLNRERRHVEHVVPAIDFLCRHLGHSPSDLVAVAVGIGPGLFTGLRVGVTSARAIARALRIPVVPVASLDLLAYGARYADRLVTAVIDARRGEVFSARYRQAPGGIQRLTPYSVGSPGDLVADLAASGQEVLLVGDGAWRHRAAFEELERAEIASPAHSFPSVAGLIELAVSRYEREEFCSPSEVVPLYIRRSDAEIGWAEGWR